MPKSTYYYQQHQETSKFQEEDTSSTSLDTTDENISSGDQLFAVEIDNENDQDDKEFSDSSSEFNDSLEDQQSIHNVVKEAEVCFNISSTSEDSSSERSSYISDEDDTTSVVSDDSSESDDDDVTALMTDDDVQTYCALAFSLRHNLSQDAFNDLQKLISILKPSMKINQDLFKQQLDHRCFHYCEKCEAVFPEDENAYLCQTNNCGNFRYKGNRNAQTKPKRIPRATFVIANIENQLRSILEKEGVWESVIEKKRSVIRNRQGISDTIRDITDGQSYKEMCQPGQCLSEEVQLSAVLNSDGIPLYSSSKVKLWPIFLAVNELPPVTRFSRDNIILAGIWQGKGNPPFLGYLYTFAQEINKMNEEGCEVSFEPTLEKLKVKLHVVCATMDLQAKAYALNMSMHNGEYGCSTCEEPGKVVKKGKGHMRCYPYRHMDQRAQERDHDTIVDEYASNASTKKRIRGICGISGLCAMPHLNIVRGIVPDYMHGVLLGVTKTLLYLWFSPTNSSKPYFVGKYLTTISERFNSIKPPDFIERLPRDLEKNFSNFKASELQNWLLFYAIPCMKDILPERYFKHLCLLSEGIYLLLGDQISSEEIDRATALLDSFYEELPLLYGEQSCGLNVHNVGQHVVEYVKKWGPLWAWSCFPFEDMNSTVLESVHGTGDVTKQCLHIQQLESKVSNLDLNTVAPKEAQRFIKKMRSKTRQWVTEKTIGKCHIAGALGKVKDDEVDRNLLEFVHATAVAELQKAYRVQVNGNKLYSKQYGKMKKRICHVVCCVNGELASVEYFLINTSTESVFAVCTRVNLEENCFVNAESGHHILQVRFSDEQCYVRVEDINEKVIFMTIEGISYVCRLPNGHGHSVFK